MAGLISQSGSLVTIQGAGEWVAEYSEVEKEQALLEEPELKEKWDPVHGDRMSEIVIIGIDMNHTEIEASLDHCLLTEEEMNMDWTTFNDPLPAYVEA